jgi:hypothetical protein
VRKGAELIATEEQTVGGQLGRPSGARFRTYERLKRYAEEVKGTIFESQELNNTTSSTNALQVSVPELHLGVPLDTTLDTGEFSPIAEFRPTASHEILTSVRVLEHPSRAGLSGRSPLVHVRPATGRPFPLSFFPKSIGTLVIRPVRISRR